MKFAILATGTSPEELREDFGTYADMCEAMLSPFGNDEFTVFNVMDGIFPADIHDFDAWAVTGSPSGVYEREDWMIRLEDLIRSIWEARMPLLGICFGHQIVASAMGAGVSKSNKGWGVGVHTYAVNGGLLPGISSDEPLALNVFHQDQVEEKPASAEVLASSEFCSFAALIYGESMLTFQGHPEFSPEFEQALIRLRSATRLPADIADQALKSLEQPLSVQQWLPHVYEFLKKAHLQRT